MQRPAAGLRRRGLTVRSGSTNGAPAPLTPTLPTYPSIGGLYVTHRAGCVNARTILDPAPSEDPSGRFREGKVSRGCAVRFLVPETVFGVVQYSGARGEHCGVRQNLQSSHIGDSVR